MLVYADNLLSEFRTTRNQIQEESKKEEPKKRNKSNKSYYDTFKMKFDNFEEYVESFNTRDLVYYFREIAEINGYKYVVTFNVDMGVMKRLKKTYTNTEICGMIEFLYTSNQNYLEKERLNIRLLGSKWINTIYADMLLWVDDKYVPRKKKTSRQNQWATEDSAEVISTDW